LRLAQLEVYYESPLCHTSCHFLGNTSPFNDSVGAGMQQLKQE
jgi:hypothetical protein